MGLVVGTSRGWLDVYAYLDAHPARSRLVLAAAGAYLEMAITEVGSALDNGQTLADLARARGRNVDALKSRVVAALQQTDAPYASMFLAAMVEYFVDLPWPARTAGRSD